MYVQLTPFIQVLFYLYKPGSVIRLSTCYNWHKWSWKNDSSNVSYLILFALIHSDVIYDSALFKLFTKKFTILAESRSFPAEISLQTTILGISPTWSTFYFACLAIPKTLITFSPKMLHNVWIPKKCLTDIYWDTQLSLSVTMTLCSRSTPWSILSKAILTKVWSCLCSSKRYAW